MLNSDNERPFEFNTKETKTCPSTSKMNFGQAEHKQGNPSPALPAQPQCEANILDTNMETNHMDMDIADDVNLEKVDDNLVNRKGISCPNSSQDLPSKKAKKQAKNEPKPDELVTLAKSEELKVGNSENCSLDPQPNKKSKKQLAKKLKPDESIAAKLEKRPKAKKSLDTKWRQIIWM